MPILPAAVAAQVAGAGINALKGAPAALGVVAGALSKSAREHRKQLWSDVDQMNSGQLGMSQAEKNQAMNNVNQQIQAANAGAMDQMRQLAATGGVGNSGAANQMRAQLAAQGSNAAASAMSNLENQSQQQVLQRAADIKNRLYEQKQQTKADTEKFFNSLAGMPMKKPTFGITPDKQAINTVMGVQAPDPFKPPISTPNYWNAPQNVTWKLGAQPYVGG